MNYFEIIYLRRMTLFSECTSQAVHAQAHFTPSIPFFQPFTNYAATLALSARLTIPLMVFTATL
jgi:hypothetical protein